ncbi:MAG: SprT family zinc-dependent metalloprotease [Methylophaga sp.]|nr:SprT family zinc-dependent metalloprotease [Methylophaga sp.]
MSTFELNGINIAVKRSARRKTMALKVRGDEVSLHLPKRVPLWLGKQFAAKQQDWLNARLLIAGQQTKRLFTADSEQPYLGISYPLQLNPNLKQRRQLIFNDQQFNLKLPTNSSAKVIKNALMRGYRQLAEVYLPDRCQQLADLTGLQPKRIQLRSYKARWGSCNARGEVQLNWLLIQAPPAVIDYVIIHELCHLQQMNHSANFWQLVEQFAADYRDHRSWLKQHGLILML